MKSAYLIVLAVGLMNVAVGIPINENLLDDELTMCGPELQNVLKQLCGTYDFNLDVKYTPERMQRIEAICCAKKCNVYKVLQMFCNSSSYWFKIMRANKVVLPSTTEKTTTKMPMTMSAVKMPTTTEKLASIWSFTG